MRQNLIAVISIAVFGTIRTQYQCPLFPYSKPLISNGILVLIFVILRPDCITKTRHLDHSGKCFETFWFWIYSLTWQFGSWKLPAICKMY